MKVKIIVLSVVVFIALSCKQREETQVVANTGNQVTYAKGFSLYNYDGFSILKVRTPWVGARDVFTYVLKKEGGTVPDSLARHTIISVPVKSAVVTSTTHIPALELLDESNSLVGFPGLDFVSSVSVRKQIENGHVQELGQNELLNMEVILDLDPEVLVAFAMDGHNLVLDKLANAGVPIVFNGDWTEETPLGKAEWLKLFGALYDKQEVANRLFTGIVSNYEAALELIATAKTQPTVLSGALYQDVWYAPQGASWMALYFKDAKASYVWKNTKGTGSLALSFESVFESGQEAEYWINPGGFETLEELKNGNKHSEEFASFAQGKVYSLTMRKGATGGVLFYELGPMRPDLILKDLGSIFHPELFVDYEPYFYAKLE